MKFGVSSWHGARVGVQTYLLDGAIDGGEANGIIRDPKLELESSRKSCWKDYRSNKVKVHSTSNSWWEASILSDEKKGGQFRMYIE
ncbi:hypothetical protein Tco_1155585 [Tanacetum coccineum]